MFLGICLTTKNKKQKRKEKELFQKTYASSKNYTVKQAQQEASALQMRTPFY